MWSVRNIILLITILAVYSNNAHPLVAEEQSIESFVIGGNATYPFEYPFICSLQTLNTNNSSRHTCGATILTDEWILTAAHCIYHRELHEYVLLCGRWNISAEFEDGQQIRSFDRAQSHVNFTFDTFNVFDIAVLHVESPLNWTDTVQPIIIPDEPISATGDARLIGWGVYQQDPIPTLPALLQVADVPIITYEECDTALGPDSGLHPDNICTGPLSGGTGACNGDSGGPLLQRLENDEWLQIGITSWGRNPCAAENHPSVWVGVGNFLDWIHENCEECVFKK